MQGRLAETAEVCEAAVESSRLSDNPHYLFWSLFELGFARYFAGDLDGSIAAGQESAQVGDRLAGGTMPAAGGGPGWQLVCAFFEAGQVQRAWDAMQALGSDDLEHKVPVERNFDWEIMGLVALALGRPEVADDYARRAEENAARLDLKLPEALALRARAAVLLHAGAAAEAAEKCRRSVAAADAIGARLVAGFSRHLLGEALAAAGDRQAAVAAWREAEHELDACGSVRVRDEARRALRKLGARVEPRGPAAGADAGVEALTKREREIADLVTDRHTNREIAARLFLSDKTIESHLRNIFIKLGVSSRVEVARTVERSR
jgi:DNA-binding CsgD family transcriptional regulator